MFEWPVYGAVAGAVIGGTWSARMAWWAVPIGVLTGAYLGGAGGVLAAFLKR